MNLFISILGWTYLFLHIFVIIIKLVTTNFRFRKEVFSNRMNYFKQMIIFIIKLIFFPILITIITLFEE